MPHAGLFPITAHCKGFTFFLVEISIQKVQKSKKTLLIATYCQINKQQSVGECSDFGSNSVVKPVNSQSFWFSLPLLGFLQLKKKTALTYKHKNMCSQLSLATKTGGGVLFCHVWQADRN
jgi:hypothetical protein